MPELVDIWRHPIKGVGCEKIPSVALTAFQTLPWDRHWAIAHDASKFDPQNPAWMRCVNFMRGAAHPKLMMIVAALDEETGRITLSGPDLESININPDDPQEARLLIGWIAQISTPSRAQPAFVGKAIGRGMTDSQSMTISLLSVSSLDALSKMAGIRLDQRRFRGNLWMSGFEAWEEFDMVGSKVRIGEAELEITKPIERCKATWANPENGQIDCQPPALLERAFGHENFGVYALVTKSGRIRTGDKVERI